MIRQRWYTVCLNARFDRMFEVKASSAKEAEERLLAALEQPEPSARIWDTDSTYEQIAPGVRGSGPWGPADDDEAFVEAYELAKEDGRV